MSHISKIELVIHSLEDLKDACRQLGFEFMKNQKTYQWYGRWVGDTPIARRGLKLKISVIAITPYGSLVVNYEVGVVKRGDHYILLWDYYSVGGLEPKIGPNAGKIKQAYTVARVEKKARRKGYRVLEKKIDQSIRLVLTA